MASRVWGRHEDADRQRDYIVLERLDADPELLAIVGSWYHTLDDVEVLSRQRDRKSPASAAMTGSRRAGENWTVFLQMMQVLAVLRFLGVASSAAEGLAADRRKVVRFHPPQLGGNAIDRPTCSTKAFKERRNDGLEVLREVCVDFIDRLSSIRGGPHEVPLSGCDQGRPEKRQADACRGLQIHAHCNLLPFPHHHTLRALQNDIRQRLGSTTSKAAIH
jgi:hypothetical protein